MLRSRLLLASFRTTLALPLTLAWLPSAAAHPQAASEVERVSRQIDRHPTAEAYLRRGNLLLASERWAEALADYARAGRLDSELTIVDLQRARALLRSARPAEALVAVGRFLEHHPEHGAARWVRARSLARVGDAPRAAESYASALPRMHSARPEHFLEYARFLQSQGAACLSAASAWAAFLPARPSLGLAASALDVRAGSRLLDRALRVLDAGLARFGPIVSIQSAAIELELLLGQGRSALQRLDTLAVQARRKEPWLARRGQILEQMGKAGSARNAYQAALAEIERLPPRHRRRPATQSLENRVRAALQRLRAEDRNIFVELNH